MGTKEPKNALFKLDFKNKYSNPKTQVTNAKLDAFGSSVERSLNNFMVTNQPQVDTEKLELVSYIKLLESQIKSLEEQTRKSLEDLQTQLKSSSTNMDNKIKAVSYVSSSTIEHLNKCHACNNKK